MHGLDNHRFERPPTAVVLQTCAAKNLDIPKHFLLVTNVAIAVKFIYISKYTGEDTVVAIKEGEEEIELYLLFES